jgi:hypothetical protein
MRLLKPIFTALLAAAPFAAGGTDARAGDYYTRQYYSSWHRPANYNYYYRTYYYKPSPTYYGYKHHYVIYYPSRPQHYYYYNPYKKTYWGRCPSQLNGTEQYSLLAEADRKGDLDSIKESAFPNPGPMPPIPESSDGAKVDLPPDDLPDAGTLPKGKGTSRQTR